MVHIFEGIRIEQLGFHYPEEVLHHGIVQAVALATHALDYAMLFQRQLIVVMLVMPPLIGVQYQSFLYFP